ncbi:MAG: RNA ligase RtcB family protein [Cyanobacteria bacterium J06621_11]
MGNQSAENAAKHPADAGENSAAEDSVLDHSVADHTVVVNNNSKISNGKISNIKSSDAIVRVIASENNWIEGNAVRQLERTAQLKGMQRAVGMPDLHAGKGCPIGAAFLAKGWIYPALVGNDIGCGMGLWRTELKANKLKLEKWATKLYLDGPWEGNTAAWLAEHGLPSSLFQSSMGTIGGGNHFAELQRVETVCDQNACAALGIEKKWLYVLAHSGSRGLGHEILRDHVDRFRDQGLNAESDEAAHYLERHDEAVKWAVANRALIAHRFLSALRSEGENIFDLAHNTVTPQRLGDETCKDKTEQDETYWLHRKGAAPSDQGILVIPGSRGSYSYLVHATRFVNHEENAFSLAHGAGRKWMRSEVKPRLSKYRPDDFLKTDLGSLVVCEDKALLYEEAPQAYKNIDVVIQDMVDAGLITVLAVLRPVLTYKTRRRQRWREMSVDSGTGKRTDRRPNKRTAKRRQNNSSLGNGGVRK